MSAKPKQPEIVRSAAQLQRAHDLLTNLIVNEEMQNDVLGDDPERELTLKAMHASADVLCWALGHVNDNFVDNLLKLEAALLLNGYDLHDFGQLVHLEGDGDGPLPS